MLVSLLLKVNLNILSLNSRLDISSVIDLSSRSLNGLVSASGSINWLSGHCLSSLLSLRLSIEFYGFSIVYYLSVVYWLGVVLLSRHVYGSSVYLSLGNGSSSDRVVVNSFGLSSVNVDYLLDGFDGWLNVSLSNSKLSWDFHVY